MLCPESSVGVLHESAMVPDPAVAETLVDADGAPVTAFALGAAAIGTTIEINNAKTAAQLWAGLNNFEIKATPLGE